MSEYADQAQPFWIKNSWEENQVITALSKRLLDMHKVWKLFTNKGSTASYALLTAIFTVVPEECFKTIVLNYKWPDSTINLLNRLIVCVVIFALANIGYSVYRKHRKKSPSAVTTSVSRSSMVICLR